MKFAKNSYKLEKTLLGSFEVDPGCQGTKSAILSSLKLKQLFRICEFPSSQKWKLIYRAIQDGFGANQFHIKCDNQPNTFVLIKSGSGNVFGGFTSQDWATNGYKTDPNAFIFSFINKDNKPLAMKCHRPTKAVYCSVQECPSFGTDIIIKSNSNTNNNNSSDLGYCYSHPQYVFGSDEAKSFLAGSEKFLATEIEIFTKE